MYTGITSPRNTVRTEFSAQEHLVTNRSAALGTANTLAHHNHHLVPMITLARQCSMRIASAGAATACWASRRGSLLRMHRRHLSALPSLVKPVSVLSGTNEGEPVVHCVWIFDA